MCLALQSRRPADKARGMTARIPQATWGQLNPPKLFIFNIKRTSISGSSKHQPSNPARAYRWHTAGMLRKCETWLNRTSHQQLWHILTRFFCGPALSERIHICRSQAFNALPARAGCLVAFWKLDVFGNQTQISSSLLVSWEFSDCSCMPKTETDVLQVLVFADWKRERSHPQQKICLIDIHDRRSQLDMQVRRETI